jgi:hypothetical protein
MVTIKVTTWSLDNFCYHGPNSYLMQKKIDFDFIPHTQEQSQQFSHDFISKKRHLAFLFLLSRFWMYQVGCVRQMCLKWFLYTEMKGYVDKMGVETRSSVAQNY